jgi:hypothetical protein
MTDKQIIIDVSGCTHKKNDACMAITSFCGDFKHYCDDLNDCYYKQLKRKEQEWEELKNEYWKLEQGNDFIAEKNSKLKGCLTEIKEIAEWHTTKADSEDVQEDMKQILQKISEVEDG